MWLGDLHFVFSPVEVFLVLVATVGFELYRCDLVARVQLFAALISFSSFQFRTEPLSYIGRTPEKKVLVLCSHFHVRHTWYKVVSPLPLAMMNWWAMGFWASRLFASLWFGHYSGRWLLNAAAVMHDVSSLVARFELLTFPVLSPSVCSCQDTKGSYMCSGNPVLFAARSWICARITHWAARARSSFVAPCGGGVCARYRASLR